MDVIRSVFSHYTSLGQLQEMGDLSRQFWKCMPSLGRGELCIDINVEDKVFNRLISQANVGKQLHKCLKSLMLSQQIRI